MTPFFVTLLLCLIPRSHSTYQILHMVSVIRYAYEPGLIARLLGAVLEAAHAYGSKVTAQMNVCVSFPLDQ